MVTKKLTVLSLAMLGGVVCATTTTFAIHYDEKVFNGADCAFTNAAQASGMDRTLARLKNVSGANQQVTCPVLRDSLSSDIESVWIIASSEMDEDTCRLRERRSDGDTGVWVHSDVDAAGADHNQTWWFKGSSEGVPADDNASLQIVCDLPDDREITTYYIKED